MRILLAEDDFVTRKFMSNFLSKYGECDVTVDGLEAVDAYMMALEEGNPYDLDFTISFLHTIQRHFLLGTV